MHRATRALDRARRALPLSAALLLAAALLSAPEAAQAGGPAAMAAEEPGARVVVNAVVRDATTGQPVAGVHVRAAGRDAWTDADGAFLLHAPDTAVATFSRLGYATARVAVGAIAGEVLLRLRPVLLDGLVAETAPNGLATGTALMVATVDRTNALASGATSVAELLGGMEGVSVVRPGSWGGKATLRGLGGERLAVLVDGNRVNRGCAFGMDQGLATLDPATVERIEVLAGPGSALYGSGNVGGVINVVTRRPSAAAGVSGEVRTGASSAVPGGTLGGSLSVRRPAWDASVALDAARYGDYRTAANTVDGSGYRQLTADVKTGLTPTAAQRLELQGQVYEARDIGWPAAGGHESGIPEQSRRSLSLDHGWQLGRGSLDAVSSRAYVQRIDHHMLMSMRMGSEAMPMTSTTDARSHSTTSGARAQLRLLPSPRSHIDAGIEATRWAAEATRWMETTGGRGSTEQVLRTWPAVRITDLGAFAQGELRFGATAVSGGARLDRITRRAEEHTTSREWVGTGNVGARVALGGGFGLRTSVGIGYRVPDPTELFGLAFRPDGLYRGNAELDTETSRNAELTLSRDGNRISASLTGFRNDLHDMIMPVLVEGETAGGRPVRTYANVMQARLTGATAGFRWQAGSVVALRGSGTYTRGERLDTHQPLPGIAPLEGSLAVRTTAPAGAAWSDLELRGAARQGRPALNAGEVETPASLVLNLRAGTRHGAWAVTAGVDNALNAYYRNHVDPVTLHRPGRNLFLRLAREF